MQNKEIKSKRSREVTFFYKLVKNLAWWVIYILQQLKISNKMLSTCPVPSHPLGAVWNVAVPCNGVHIQVCSAHFGDGWSDRL